MFSLCREVKPIKISNPLDILYSFIVKTYPVEEYPRVLEVAAGSGSFSRKLDESGYQVTIMDPRTKKDSLPGTIDVKQECFGIDTDISVFDFGVSIYPEGVHESFIKNFTINEKPFFILPCLYNANGEKYNFSSNNDWLKYLMSLNKNMETANLYNDLNNHSLIPDSKVALYTKL